MRRARRSRGARRRRGGRQGTAIADTRTRSSSDWAVILLAAGASRRMGRPKALIPFRGRPLIAHQVRSLERLRPRAVIAVTQRALLARLRRSVRSEPCPAALCWAVNPHPERGPFSSLQAGLEALADAARPWPAHVAVLPVDCPSPPPAVWRRLLARFVRDEAVRAVIPCRGGRGGHPVFLRADLARALRRRDPARPGNRLDWILRRLRKGAVVRLASQPASVLANWNAPGDVRSAGV